MRDQPGVGPTRIEGRDYKATTRMVRDWTVYIGLHGVAVAGVFIAYFLLLIINTAAVYFITSNAVVLGIMAPSMVLAIVLWRTRRVPRSQKEQKLWNEIEVLKRGGHFNGVAENLQKLSESGNLKAMLQLAELFDAGRGVARNPQRAFNLVQQAAKCGHVESLHALGTRYLNGLGVTVDIATALKWFKAAADHGLPEASMSLGYLHEHPRRNSDPDLQQAANWYRQATERYLMAKQAANAKAALMALVNAEPNETVIEHLKSQLQSLEPLPR